MPRQISTIRRSPRIFPQMCSREIFSRETFKRYVQESFPIMIPKRDFKDSFPGEISKTVPQYNFQKRFPTEIFKRDFQEFFPRKLFKRVFQESPTPSPPPPYQLQLTSWMRKKCIAGGIGSKTTPNIFNQCLKIPDGVR